MNVECTDRRLLLDVGGHLTPFEFYLTHFTYRSSVIFSKSIDLV